MSNNTSLTKHEQDASHTPAWLIQALELAGDYAAFMSDQHAPVSEAFRARARETLSTFNRLQAERERVGFVARPFGQYVESLAIALGLSLTPVLQWLAIPNFRHPTPHTAGAFAKLGLEIGLGLTEILAHVRIAIADLAGFSPSQMLMARHRGGASALTNVRLCNAMLDEIETQYNPSTREQLRRIEQEITSVYRNHLTPEQA
jgi:hypothetical protein